MAKRPNSMRHLDDAIRRAVDGGPEQYVRARTVMANAIVASLLPDGVVKGGCAIKMRLGDAATRFTTDLDTATATEPTLYAQRLSEALAAGWEGFTGRVVPREPATPKDVPAEYVMQPFDVKLSFMGKPWCTVPLEVGFNEIGDAENADWCALDDVAALFDAVGLPTPAGAPLMVVEHQVAQKLHAASSVGDRARDMVDLQLLVMNTDIDYEEVRRVCVRLFAYRKMQQWPPVVAAQDGWDELYAAQANGLPVLQGLDEALAWTNGFIAQLDAAK